MDGEDMYAMKTGAIAAFLDNLGVKGNLHGPAVNLLAILNGLDEKNRAMAKCETCGKMVKLTPVYYSYCCGHRQELNT